MAEDLEEGRGVRGERMRRMRRKIEFFLISVRSALLSVLRVLLADDAKPSAAIARIGDD
jgi:hypothetical protein